MNHYTASSFWDAYHKLPKNIQIQSNKKFDLLKVNPHHPSLHFKQIDKFWSVRIGLRYRALGIGVIDGVLWFWTGNHDDYDRLIKLLR